MKPFGAFSLRQHHRPQQAHAQNIRLDPQGAQSKASILIAGPSGTGKELIAKAIHIESRAKTGLLFRSTAAL